MPSESEEHKAIVAWYRETYPQYAMSLRVSQTGSAARGKAGNFRWRAQQARGAVKGESDIQIALKRGGFGSLFIEHKTKDGKATQAQLDYIQYHNAIGNCAVVTKGIDMAKAAIRQYMEG